MGMGIWVWVWESPNTKIVKNRVTVLPQQSDSGVRPTRRRRLTAAAVLKCSSSSAGGCSSSPVRRSSSLVRLTLFSSSRSRLSQHVSLS
ncbi:hypothetical protein LINPERHAP1_LOCUS35138 [Linum perenne]